MHLFANQMNSCGYNPDKPNENGDAEHSEQVAYEAESVTLGVKLCTEKSLFVFDQLVVDQFGGDRVKRRVY